MTLIAIPNVSEGRDTTRLSELRAALETFGARVLDVHVDGAHHRSVFTLTGPRDRLPPAMAELARRMLYVDLRSHQGVHPRLGGLDVCPIVPHDGPMSEAVTTARLTARAIAERAALPVYLYGDAALRPETRELPDLRRGGLEELARRASASLPPDNGPRHIDLSRGVVCVGARRELIAFNVWLRAGKALASRIAARVRSSGGGLPGVRALGIRIDDEMSQVSMNLIDPETTGIDRAFVEVAGIARGMGADVVATEIVGLVPQRFLPDPHAQAARLLMAPGRSLEATL